MTADEKFKRFIERHPHSHAPFFARPHASRRQFFQLLGSGLTGSLLTRNLSSAAEIVSHPVNTINKARNVIFILLTGAPSHTDTFDFKNVDGITPTTFKPESINGVNWPTGLLPKLAGQLPNFAIARSVRAWALVHSLGKTWVQIGRNPVAALGNIAPNIGSVVAIEKDKERRTNQVFPAFLALNSNAAAGPGYFSASYAPFKVTAATGAPARGLPNTTTSAGQNRGEGRWNLLRAIDGPLRNDSPLGRPAD
ncbi:MAG: DUF1501 domain-containing protein, partial [Bryobacteraceae bacterium]